MKELRNTFYLMAEEDSAEYICKIKSVTYYDENNEFDEGETFFIHPLTGSECQEVTQVLSGWSEQNKKDQNDWNTLVEEIKNDEELSQKIFEMEEIAYFK